MADMEENIKKRLIFLFGILALIFFITTLVTCSSVGKIRGVRDKEMALRLELEEKLGKKEQEKIDLEQKLNALNQKLQEEEVTHQATKKALFQEHLVNESLKEELQKVTKLKEALEEDLKEALVTDRGKKTKR